MSEQRGTLRGEWQDLDTGAPVFRWCFEPYPEAFDAVEGADDKQAWLRRMNIKHHGTPTSPVSGKRGIPHPGGAA